VIVRDKIGSFKERNEMEAWLNKWISQYVLSTRRRRVKRPGQYPLSRPSHRRGESRAIPGITARVLSAAALSAGRFDGVAALVSKLPSARAGSDVHVSVKRS